MSALADIPGLLLGCAHCGRQGNMREFSQYAQTETPLIQCRQCGGPAQVVYEFVPLIDPERRFEYGKGRGITKAWKEFERLPQCNDEDDDEAWPPVDREPRRIKRS